MNTEITKEAQAQYDRYLSVQKEYKGEGFHPEAVAAIESMRKALLAIEPTGLISNELVHSEIDFNTPFPDNMTPEHISHLIEVMRVIERTR